MNQSPYCIFTVEQSHESVFVEHYSNKVGLSCESIFAVTVIELS